MIAKAWCTFIALILMGGSTVCWATEEELQKDSLIGVKHVHLVIQGTTLLDELDDKQIKKQIELQLSQCGIKILPLVDCMMTQDSPILILTAYEETFPYNPKSLFQHLLHYNMILRQNVYTARTPRGKIAYVETWKAFDKDIHRIERGKLVSRTEELVRVSVRRFINDYLAANPREGKVEPSKSSFGAVPTAGVAQAILESSITLASKESDTLVGLKSMSVLVENLKPKAKEYGLTRSALQRDIELKLRQNGIRVLSEKEFFSPEHIWPILYANINIGINEEQRGFAIVQKSIELRQPVLLLRKPAIFYPSATTWRTECLSTVGLNKLEDIRESVRDQVDEFINDYLAANPKEPPVKKEEKKPKDD